MVSWQSGQQMGEDRCSLRGSCLAGSVRYHLLTDMVCMYCLLARDHCGYALDMH